MKILAVDPSTKTAYAVIGEEGVLTTDQLKTSKDDTDLARGIQTAEWVRLAVEEYKPEVVIVEGYSLNSKFNLATMVVIGTCIRNMLYHENICWYDVPPTKLKQWLTGKGTSSKKDMISHVARRFGFVTKSDDIADAVALAYAGEAMFYTQTAAFNPKDLHCATKILQLGTIIFDKGKV